MGLMNFEPNQSYVPAEIVHMFKKRKLTVPKLVGYGVEDSAIGYYDFDGGLRLEYGPPWCAERNAIAMDNYKRMEKIMRESGDGHETD